jgi:hypothetical protein
VDPSHSRQDSGDRGVARCFPRRRCRGRSPVRREGVSYDESRLVKVAHFLPNRAKVVLADVDAHALAGAVHAVKAAGGYDLIEPALSSQG